jgi:outer membrane protein assembly factor BamE
MPAIYQSRSWLLAAAVAATLCLGACSSFSGLGDRTRGALSSITPYKVEVVQGNFVSKEQVALLKTGMSRQQVKEVLGTPLLNDIFHANRWDYVFTIRRQGVDPQQRRLTVYFNGELLDHFEGDTMPSEEEFVATLDSRAKGGKVPVLEASEDTLKKFVPPKEEKADATSAAMVPLPAAYPPLETTR